MVLNIKILLSHAIRYDLRSTLSNFPGIIVLIDNLLIIVLNVSNDIEKVRYK